jgi:exosortase A-associated hydrolase 2
VCAATDVFFLAAGDGTRGQRLCLHHRAQGPATRGAVVYVHPFAEEMNKSRRMAALQSRAFALAGFSVLQIDLYGCGDSSGDFGDATWECWIEDVLEAASWMAQRHDGPLTLWGLRAGCLLATAAANRIEAPVNLLLWQPVVAGKTLLQQFLRLAMAGDMLGGQTKGATERLKGRFAAGDSIEVAGYRLSPALAGALEGAALALPDATGRVMWLEVSSRDGAGLLPASESRLDRWRKEGRHVAAQVGIGPAFWQTTEIEDAPALIDMTLAAMTERLAA